MSARTEHYADLRKHYLDQPNEVSLETLAKCNASCSFCPYPTLDRIGTKMPDELIHRLIDEMSEFRRPFALSPFKVNEPLLDRRFIPICEEFNRKVPQGFLRIFTNGTALTDDNINAVNRLGNVIHLWVSLNSHIPEDYDRLMGISWKRTTDRLDALHRSSFRHPVMLSCVGFPNEDFRRYCYDRWPKFDSMAIRQTSWLGFTDAQDNEVPDEACSRWFELSVAATGVVSLCCMDGEAAYPIGDLNKQTLLEVYNAPAWRERRELMLSRRGIHPCSTCTY